MLLDVLKKSRQQDYLCDHIPLVELLYDDKTIITNNGSLVQVVALSGLDYGGMSHGDQENYAKLRTKFFNDLADPTKERFHITFHTRRKRVNAGGRDIDYGSDWFNKFAAAREKQFEDIYRSEIFMVIRMKVKASNLFKGNVAGSFDYKVEHERLRVLVSELDNYVSSVCGMFAAYDPHVLVAQGKTHAPLYEFWAYVLNGGRDIPKPEQRAFLNRILAVSDISMNMKEKRVEFEHAEGTRYAAFLSVNVYPDETTEKMFSYLNSVRHQFSVVQHIFPVTRDSAQSRIKTKIGHLNAFRGFSAGRVEEMEFLGNEIERGELVIHDHALSICVYGTSPGDLENGILQVRTALAHGGISVIREQVNIYGAFFSQFPDCEIMNEARVYPVTTDNLAGFINLSGYSEGNTACAFGDAPVTFLKTLDGGNYAFTFHPSAEKAAPGHTLIVGDTGSGKSVLAFMLLKYCFQYQGNKGEEPFKAVLFDSLGGLKIPTMAFGGDYVDMANLSVKGGLPLNPFLLPDTGSNRSFLEHFLSILTDPKSAEERSTIQNAVRQAYDLEPKERILYNIKSAFGVADVKGGEGNLAYRLEPWLPDEKDPTKSTSPYGLVFNSPTDALNFKNPLVTFEMGSLLARGKEALLAPVAFYIEHVFSEYINRHPSPHMWFVDEMARYVNDPHYGAMILKALREWRKRNGVIMGAVQELSALTKSQNGCDMLENVQTFILYPTPGADREDYMGKIGLTDNEFEWIKSPQPRYQVMIKRKGGSSVKVDINLSGVGAYLHLFDSGNADKLKVTQLMKQDKENWVEHYLNYKTGNVK